MKIAIVHTLMKQHGTEKFMYEFTRLARQKGLDVDAYVSVAVSKRDYYYKEFYDIGVVPRRIFVTRRQLTFPLKRYRSIKAFRKISNFILLPQQIWLRWRLKKYDKVFFWGMETYVDLFPDLILGNARVVHVMNSFQMDEYYVGDYNLASIIVTDQTQTDELKLEKPALKTHNVGNLIIDSTRYKKIKIEYKTTFNHIALVSRLEASRPNEAIFDFFKVLENRFASVTLLIYGAGNKKIYSSYFEGMDEKSKVNPICRYSFLGHSSNLYSSFVKDEVQIGISVCMGNAFSYSALEMILMGVPVIFVNISDRPNSELPGSYSYPDEIPDNFFEPKALRQLAQQQFKFAVRKFGTQAFDSLLNA